MATDEQLIEQIRYGNSEVYSQLFRKYYQQIYSICFAILRNTYDAEEVTQETFVQAYLKLNQLKKPDKFFAWLKKIAQNRCKNYMQQMKPTFSLTDEQLPVQSEIATLAQIAPDEHILKQELIDSIMEAVEALPPKDREIVRAHIDGLNHAEISERFGISVEASMSRLYRARKKLAARMKDLLNAIFGLPKILPLKKIISGGIVAMKIGTSAKVTIGVIGVLAAGFIGFQIVTHQPDVKSPKVVTQQPKVKSEVKQKPISKMSSRLNKSEKVIQNDQDVEEQVDKFLARPDAPKQSPQGESKKISEQEEIEEQELPAELKEKIELFNALMRILPVYEEVQQSIDEAAKEVANHVNSLDIDRYETIHYGSDSEGRMEITVLDKHGQRIVNDPYLDSFLSELYEKEERVIQLVNRQNATLHEIDELYPGAVEWSDGAIIMAPTGIINDNVLRGYLGKELPWSRLGYSSYFDAKDYKSKFPKSLFTF
ncbi:RNA polymerase sigma factor [Candidatus Poribacteria bacterium]|nr:RNA polymerase sigma factor [Candidatus Poribacteria bacterium]